MTINQIPDLFNKLKEKYCIQFDLDVSFEGMREIDDFSVSLTVYKESFPKVYQSCWFSVQGHSVEDVYQYLSRTEWENNEEKEKH